MRRQRPPGYLIDVRLAVLAAALALGACFGPVGPSAVVPPPCPHPAPLLGEYDSRAPGYIVAFVAGVDGAAETARLERRYDITATYVFLSLDAFSAALHPTVVARLRCEPTVAYVERDAAGSVSD
jgi:hypothetical protein